jgi:DNA-binding CsgD family transcriptional regulator|tara:strand:- start:101 stop:460 length:360 start_codon:yes stop_codon:yes gene_type:complete
MKKLTTFQRAILVSAFASLWISLTMWFTGNEMVALYVGMWTPTILSLSPFFKDHVQAKRKVKMKTKKTGKRGRPVGWRKHNNVAARIIKMRRRGHTIREISETMNVPKSTIHNYIKRGH